ncbi:MAG: ParA family protein [Actinomycetota bacterium]
MKKVVFFNAKGGTGKTTLCYNYGWYLAEKKNKRVLMLDFDPQINLVESFDRGVANKYGNNLDTLIKNYIDGMQIKFSSYITKINKNLDILPTSNNISLMEEYLTNHIIARTFSEKVMYKAKYRNQIIKKVLEEKIDEDSYDYVIIDSQPNFSLLSTSSIIYARNIFVVVKPELFSFLDIKYLMKIISKLEKDFYVKIKIVGVIINAFEKRKKDSEYLAKELVKRYGDRIRVYNQRIRYLSHYQKSIATQRKPIFKAYPDSEAAKDMLDLFEEIMNREDEFYFR